MQVQSIGQPAFMYRTAEPRDSGSVDASAGNKDDKVKAVQPVQTPPAQDQGKFVDKRV
ncbi:MAG: hypothetical protein QOJ96_2298 [Alphaproteobacteria bacterium]|jgi:hypothetical protein|nr:hypothetical protein [Alphaproteobacteria bacterium]